MAKFVTFDSSGALMARYDSALHVIPDTALKVPDALFCRTISEIDGLWTLVEGEVVKLPLPELLPGADELIEVARVWRDSEISKVVWIRDRHRDELELGATTSITAEQHIELLGFIQQLRDWPQGDEFPDESSRPIVPDWVATQTH